MNIMIKLTIIIIQKIVNILDEKIQKSTIKNLNFKINKFIDSTSFFIDATKVKVKVSSVKYVYVSSKEIVIKIYC